MSPENALHSLTIRCLLQSICRCLNGNLWFQKTPQKKSIVLNPATKLAILLNFSKSIMSVNVLRHHDSVQEYHLVGTLFLLTAKGSTMWFSNILAKYLLSKFFYGRLTPVRFSCKADIRLFPAANFHYFEIKILKVVGRNF